MSSTLVRSIRNQISDTKRMVGQLCADQESTLHSDRWNNSRCSSILSKNGGEMSKERMTNYFVLPLVIALFFLYMYWLFYPYEVITVSRVKVLNVHQYAMYNNKEIPVFKRGEMIELEMDYTKYEHLPTNISRTLIKQDEPFKDLTEIIDATIIIN